MIIMNGGGYYQPPFGSAPFSGMPNHFGIASPPTPPYYKSPFPQQSQQRLVNPPSPRDIPSFKLYDLASNERSEIIRLIFSYAGVSFKDKRLTEEEWTTIQEQTSFEQLPILRVSNHFRIFHFQAIVNYLAREFHLYGVDKQDHALLDIILETIRPLQDKIFEQLKSSTNQEQSFQDHINIYLKKLEKFYEIFHRRGPFYLGAQISIVDLIVYDTINWLLKINPKLLEHCFHLKETRRCLEKHPGIVSYIKTKTSKSIQRTSEKTSQSQRHRTKSPTPSHPPPHHHHHEHRHRSRDGHHHHRHHHRHSKESTPPFSNQTTIRQIIQITQYVKKRERISSISNNGKNSTPSINQYRSKT